MEDHVWVEREDHVWVEREGVEREDHVWVEREGVEREDHVWVEREDHVFLEEVDQCLPQSNHPHLLPKSEYRSLQEKDIGVEADQTPAHKG